MLSRHLAPFRTPGAPLAPRVDLNGLRGGVAVVTGSASGLGYALAAHARSIGLHVALSDVRAAPLADAVRQLGASPDTHGAGLRVEGFLCDVTSTESVLGLLASVQASRCVCG